MTSLLLAVVLPLLLVVATHGYPDGAPDSAETCNSLRPDHYIVKYNITSGKWEPNTAKPLNYSIHVDKTRVSAGEAVQVIIRADQLYFEGFILQARSASDTSDSSKKYGTFKPHDGDAKTICYEAGITQTRHHHWRNITFSWIAPQNIREQVKFVATVVKGYKTYFMNVESGVVMVVSVSSTVYISTFMMFTSLLLSIVHQL